MRLTVVFNNIQWQTEAEQVNELKNLLARFNPEINILHTNFDNVPFSDFGNQKTVDVNWYRQNITPLVNSHGSILVLNGSQWGGISTFGSMTYNDPKSPVRMEITAYEQDRFGRVFPNRAFHEIAHMLLHLTGQRDGYIENGEQRWVVHDYLYQEVPKYQELLDLLDMVKLNQALNIIRMNQVKVIKSKITPTVYLCYPVPSEQHLEERANLEGFEIPSQIPNSDSL